MGLFSSLFSTTKKCDDTQAKSEASPHCQACCQSPGLVQPTVSTAAAQGPPARSTHTCVCAPAPAVGCCQQASERTTQVMPAQPRAHEPPGHCAHTCVAAPTVTSTASQQAAEITTQLMPPAQISSAYSAHTCGAASTVALAGPQQLPAQGPPPQTPASYCQQHSFCHNCQHLQERLKKAKEDLEEKEKEVERLTKKMKADKDFIRKLKAQKKNYYSNFQ